MHLIITRTFPPEVGGMQNLMWGLARSLSKINLIKVFADYTEGHQKFDNTVSFSIERVSGVKLLRKYRKSYLINEYLNENKNVKCLIADHWKSLELIKTNKKKICLIHSKEINHPKGSRLNKKVLEVLNNVDHVVANSNFTKNLAIEIGVEEKRIVVINPGVDEVIEISKKDLIKAEEFFKGKQQRLITVSRFDKRKNHEKVIMAIRNLKEIYPDIIYTCIGYGEEEENLKKLVIELKLEDQVKFLKDIPNELNISDLFGDANLSGDTADTYEGSIGIKFGVRLVLIPNEQLKTLLAGDSWNSVIVNTEKSYSFADTSVVPLVSYERDIKDVKFNELDFTDSNLGEDLKCYIDKLVSTDQYRLVMDYLIGLRKVPTIMSIYMNHTFLASVGSSESERDEDAKLLGFIDVTSDAWKAEVLEDTKKECRRLFASFYRSDDFAPEEGADNDASLREVLDKTLAVVFAIPRGFIHWLRRRRLRRRPFDKDGNPCKNVFQRVFNPE